MVKYRDSIIYSSAVDIKKYLPPISFLHESLNRSYRNTSNADTKLPCFLDYFLINAKEYAWWKQAENVYLPFILHSPIFSNGTPFSEISYGIANNFFENEFIRNGKVRRKLVLELATIKVWIAQYTEAIAHYQNEILRINRLKTYYKSNYILPFYSTQLGQYVNTELLTFYQNAIDRFNSHKDRLTAIQYEVEQRIVYYDANNQLPTSALTPEFAEYYTGLTYDIREYPAEDSAYRNSNIPTTSQLKPRFKPPHHFLLPEVITGNPFWAATPEEEVSYLIGEELTLAIELRLGFNFYITPLDLRTLAKYNTNRYYNPSIWDLDGESFPADNFYNLTVNVNAGTNYFRWKHSGYGVTVNDQNKYASSVVMFNPKLDKARFETGKNYYGIIPSKLKTQDAAWLSSRGLGTLGTFVPSIFESFFQAGDVETYPFSSSANFTYFMAQEIDHRYADNIRASYIAQNYLRYDAMAQFEINEYDLTKRIEVPGWQLVLNETELNTKIINPDTGEVFYKRSAVIEFPTTTLQTKNGTRVIEPVSSFPNTKIWFGSDVAKPTAFPNVKFYTNDYNIYYNISGQFPFSSKSPNPNWLLPSLIYFKNDIPEEFKFYKVRQDFVSNSLVETYYYILNYTDNNNIPQSEEITLYTITYDLSAG